MLFLPHPFLYTVLKFKETFRFLFYKNHLTCEAALVYFLLRSSSTSFQQLPLQNPRPLPNKELLPIPSCTGTLQNAPLTFKKKSPALHLICSILPPRYEKAIKTLIVLRNDSAHNLIKY